MGEFGCGGRKLSAVAVRAPAPPAGLCRAAHAPGRLEQLRSLDRQVPDDHVFSHPAPEFCYKNQHDEAARQTAADAAMGLGDIARFARVKFGRGPKLEFHGCEATFRIGPPDLHPFDDLAGLAEPDRPNPAETSINLYRPANIRPGIRGGCALFK